MPPSFGYFLWRGPRDPIPFARALMMANLELRQNSHHVRQRPLHAMLFAVVGADDGQIGSILLRRHVRLNPGDGFGVDEDRNALFSALEGK